MPSSEFIVPTWLAEPPHSWVVGSGAYGQALALVLGAEPMTYEMLAVTPEAEMGGRLPRVLNELDRVILLPESGHSAADVLRIWEAVWRWIERLSAAGEDHEVVFLVLASPSGKESMARALSVGMGMSEKEMSAHGQVVGEAGMPLSELIELLQSAKPCDHVRLVNRRNADACRRALAELVMAAESGGAGDDITTAAERVRGAFGGREYDLDLFCQPPSHANGNRLRNMVKRLVTEPVTPEFAAECALLFPKILS
jgi:hypothetical protein